LKNGDHSRDLADVKGDKLITATKHGRDCCVLVDTETRMAGLIGTEMTDDLLAVLANSLGNDRVRLVEGDDAWSCPAVSLAA